MIILIDQHGPLADFERGFLEEWRIRFPRRRYVALEDRRTFHVKDDYPRKRLADVESIYQAPGFYRGLSPVEGSISAIEEMIKLKHDVFVCTSPLSQYENCVLEKYEWVEHFLGREFTARVILSKDKTLIKGHVLIDDRPSIDGVEAGEWEHLVFDRPYNRGGRQ